MMRNKKLLLCCIPVLALAVLYFAGITGYTVKADKRGGARVLTTTPQTLPFAQNWTNTGLITTDDDWSGVPGIVGYRGDDLTTLIGTDPRTILANGDATPVDVNANHADPNTFTTGGVTEFDGIANPVVALQGSGTADAPHLVMYLNTTGKQNINFKCSIRDVDGSADDAIQQVDVQYRVGGTGNYASVSGGYIADATTGGTATQVTALDLNLPAAADNQSLLEIRVMTTNATGSDEWVGVDDINVTGSNIVVASAQHVGDWNGDGKTDFAVVRNTGGGAGGAITWFVQQNGGAPQFYAPWGSNGDKFVPADYNGDTKTDYAIWRPGPAGNAGWYILLNGPNTIRQEAFGQTGDDPTVVGDYNNDHNADMAVYRAGAIAGAPSFWYYRTTANGPVTGRQWGQNGDFPAPGDYNGDGSADFAVQRNNGGGQAAFYINYSSSAGTTIDRLKIFGTPTSIIVPGDYDGDGKTDIATLKGSGGNILWSYEPSGALNTEVDIAWGLSQTDFPVQGDYDGDGKTDLAVWRPDADPTMNYFYFRKSMDGSLGYQEWGSNGDYPVMNYNNH